MFADYKIVYKKISENWQPNFLTLLNDSYKFAGYKIYIQKSVSFLYSNNKWLEYEIKNIVLFTLAPKIYLGTNLTKWV